MFYASRNRYRDDFVNAEDVLANEQDDVFYCPCSDCRCIVKFRSMNSNKRRNHFYKPESSTHSEECGMPYFKNESGDKNDYDTASLSLENLLSSIEHSRQTVTKVHTTPKGNDINGTNKDNSSEELKPITTIRQLYKICVLNSPDTAIKENLCVKDIFAGRSTSFLYSKYISGIKLVECKYHYFKADIQTMFFEYPYNSSADKIRIRVHFADKNLFWDTYHLLKGYQKSVIIFAMWDNSSCEITNKKQIIPLSL